MNVGTRKADILVIGQSRNLFQLLETKAGGRFSFIYTESWEAAADLIKKKSINVVIARDISTNMSVYAKNLNTNRDKKLRFIILSKNESWKKIREAFNLGAFDYIVDSEGLSTDELLLDSIERAVSLCDNSTSRALKKSDSCNLFELILNKTRDGILVLKNGELIFANDTAVRMSGYSRNELLKLSFYHFIEESKVNEARKFFEDLVSRRNIGSLFETTFVTKSGVKIDVDFSINAFEQNGSQIHLITVRSSMERSELDRKFRESESKFRMLTELGPAAIAISHDQGYYYVNPAWEELFGYTFEELTDFDPFRLIHPDMLETVREYYAKRVKGEDVVSRYRCKAVTKTKTVKWLDFSIKRVKHRGKPANLMLAVDITDAVMAEEALAESKEKYRILFDESADAVVIGDFKTGAIVEGNKKFWESYGYPRERVGDLNIREIDVNESPEDTERHLKNIVEQGYDVFESRHVTNNGEIKDVIVSARAICIQGTNLGIISFHDITHRKKAEAELAESREKYRTLTELGPAGIAIGYLDKYYYANPAWGELFGFSHEEIMNEKPSNIVHPDMRDLAFEYNARRMRGEKAPSRYRLKAVTKDKKVKWLDFSNTPIQHLGQTMFLILAIDITDRIEAEEVIKASEKKFRLLFDNFSDMVFISNLQGEFLEVNRSACEKLGYSKEELLKLSPFNIYNGLTAERFHKGIDLIIEKEQGLFEVVFKDREGEQFPAELSFRMITYKDKTAVLSIARDITERKKAEAELAESREKYKILFEQAADPIVIGDFKTGTILEGNEKFWESYGFPREMAGILNVRDFSKEKTEEEVAGLLEKIRVKGAAIFESVHTTADGKVKHVITSARAISRVNEFYGLVVFHDITERKKAEKELAESREKYRILFEQAAEAVVVVSFETGMILEANKKFLKSYGYTAEEAEKLHVSDIECIEDVEEIREHMDKLIEQGVDVFETQHRTKNGEIKHVYVSARSISVDNNLCSLAFFQDITARKNMEEELQRKNRQLDDFAYRVAHDLKNPINIIQGYSLILKDDPDQLNKYSSVISAQSEKLLDFIDDVLNLSRAGKTLANVREVNLERIINQIFSLIELKKVEKKLIFKNSIPPVECDPLGMNQVFSNLMNNSVKYRKPDSKEFIISIATELDDDFITIILEDNGRGISPEIKDKMFNPGFTSNSHNGSGFGLAITRKIIEAHAGRISADNREDGNGTVFKITLPLHSNNYR